MKPSVVSAATGNPLNPPKNTVIRFPTSELVCSTKLEIYLSPRGFHGRQVIFLFSSLTNRRDLKNDVRQRTEKFLTIQQDYQVLLFDVSMFFQMVLQFQNDDVKLVSALRLEGVAAEKRTKLWIHVMMFCWMLFLIFHVLLLNICLCLFSQPQGLFISPSCVFRSVFVFTFCWFFRGFWFVFTSVFLLSWTFYQLTFAVFVFQISAHHWS